MKPVEAYTKVYIRILGDWNDHPRTRKVNLTRYDGETLTGVVEGLVWKFRPRDVFKVDGAKFTKRELKALLGEVV